MSKGRQYECIIFGATGYTGKYTAEHITTNLPTDFKWAVAGRSEGKLKALVDEIRSLNQDRTQPGIEVAQLTKSDLVTLAKKTKVLISAVGPYHKYGTVVVEACAETGTHYVDCTGETPWVYDVVNRFTSLAKKNGAILIPQAGLESAAPDLLAWIVVNHIRRSLSVGTKELIGTIYKIKAAASGGTLATIFTLLDSYSLLHVLKSMHPWSLSVVSPPKQSARKSIWEAITGIRVDPDLGILTDCPSGATDLTYVNRSWSLFEGGKFYGPNFRYSPYLRTKGRLSAFGVHVALNVFLMAIALPPVRWIMRRLVTQPGDGPSKEDAKNDFVEFRAIGNADVVDSEDPKRAFGRMRYDGSIYQLTGVFLAEAAVSLARDNTPAHKLGGGFLTPATLGAPYLERLQKAGIQTEVKTLP